MTIFSFNDIFFDTVCLLIKPISIMHRVCARCRHSISIKLSAGF